MDNADQKLENNKSLRKKCKAFSASLSGTTTSATIKSKDETGWLASLRCIQLCLHDL